jgi:membrane protease YdiL (CAAX protease family)
MLSLFTLLGAIFITINFYLKTNFENIGFLIKLPFLLGMLFFTFPLGIAVYLLFKKYKLTQLGIKIKPFSFILLGILVWGLTGIFSYVFNRSGILWKLAFEELGGIAGLLSGIISAGLVEEFSRFVMQTRFEKVFKSSGFGILFATIIWSLMHFPTNYFKGYALGGIFTYCLQIIPLGFVWGYLTYRTKSIVPATLIHGLNLWGFQNK